MHNMNNIAALIKQLKRLKVREARILEQLEAANEVQHADHPVQPPSFEIGDRVRITNRVRRPANWDERVRWNDREARNATVTGLSDGKVYFTTNNGTQTRRLPQNLRLLREEDV